MLKVSDFFFEVFLFNGGENVTGFCVMIDVLIVMMLSYISSFIWILCKGMWLKLIKLKKNLRTVFPMILETNSDELICSYFLSRTSENFCTNQNLILDLKLSSTVFTLFIVLPLKLEHR